MNCGGHVKKTLGAPYYEPDIISEGPISAHSAMSFRGPRIVGQTLYNNNNTALFLLLEQ